MSDANQTEVEYEWINDSNLDLLDLGEVYEPAMDPMQELEAALETIEPNPDVEQAVDSALATEAQALADDAIERGDYETASELREIAEESATAAGDDSMLHGANSIELEAADSHQDRAQELELQQAEHAQEGDYEAAREDAFEASLEMQTADQLAGGSDHSGQAQAEFDQMDWAVHHEEQADYYSQNAADYAEQGDFDNAEMNAEQADEHQEFADYHGDLGEHGGELAVSDPASEIETDTSYQPTDYMCD